MSQRIARETKWHNADDFLKGICFLDLRSFSSWYNVLTKQGRIYARTFYYI